MSYRVYADFGAPVTVSVTTPINARVDTQGARTCLFTVINLDNAKTIYWTLETSQNGTHWQQVGDEAAVAPGAQFSVQVDWPQIRLYYRDSARTESGSAQVDTQVIVQ